jgi:hypothetical protein
MRVLKQYLPLFGMVLATVLGILYTALQDNALSLTEFLNIAIALTGAIMTYVVPRLQNAQWLKTACAGATAVLVFLVSAVVDGSVSSQEWVMVGIQLLAGLGIVAATNKNVPVTPSVRRAA